jgi:hypothetical protein
VDVKTVVEFERWCNAMGLALDLFCKKCVDEHGPGGRCWGNNSPDSTVYHLECQCTDRVYGVDVGTDRFAPGVQSPLVEDKKIQVLVP